jgi:hypothetical protein
MPSPRHERPIDTATLLKEIRAAIRLWMQGRTTHEATCEHIEWLLKENDKWQKRKT